MLKGLSPIITAARALVNLYPPDTFVDTPVHHMQVAGEPDARIEVHRSGYAAKNIARDINRHTVSATVDDKTHCKKPVA